MNRSNKVKTKNEVKIIYLLHPLHKVPAVAQRVGYYTHEAKVIGYELQFPDGHRCSLTYAEIGQLIAAGEAYGKEEMGVGAGSESVTSKSRNGRLARGI